MNRNGSKQTWRKVYYLIAGMMILIAAPLLILGLTGKYRLLLKPRHADASKNSAAAPKPAPKTATMSKNGSPLHKKSIHEENIESLLQRYTVDFYYLNVQYPTNPDEFMMDPRNFLTKKLPVVEIPDTIRLIAGLEEEKGYVPRLEAVNALGCELPAKEVTALLYFLHKKISDDSIEPLELNAVKNNTVAVLMRQSRIPEELAPHLIAMYYDKTLDNTWRDYCIQFMGQWYDKIHVPTEQEYVRQALDAALSDSENIPAASIIAMAGLVGRPGFSRERVSAAAYKLCTDLRTIDTVKTAALQICAKFRNRDALPVAREIVRNSQNIPLKMSAVAAIGAFGEFADRELLGPLAKSGDIRIRTAAKAAIRKMKVN
ncbi:MAG TPA: hypothetical protein DET40_25160 [Lentisphaeria bacterium]|nr:MAG: hypothetical protein A2X45_18800 [Lentisphaerae bacterium GWF2_50_93]HCE46850.1 hypothetical protein [Lentisphaeria bacterium]